MPELTRLGPDLAYRNAARGTHCAMGFTCGTVEIGMGGGGCWGLEWEEGGWRGIGFIAKNSLDVGMLLLTKILRCRCDYMAQIYGSSLGPKFAIDEVIESGHW